MVSLASKVLTTDSEEMDIMRWSKARGKFTVRSAYWIARRGLEDSNLGGWKKLWEMKTS